MVFHASGQWEGPAIEQYVCVCMCVLCVYVCMCYRNQDRRGNKDGASHILVMSRAVADLQQWRPPETHSKNYSETLP